jgi:chromosome segregation ATPase
LASLEKLVIALRKKKQVATTLRKRAERQLQEARSIERRSTSGVNLIDKKIESEKENSVDISGILTQKTSQLDSIERLVASARDRITREKEALGQIEQEVEFAQNPEEKQAAQLRLDGLRTHIDELESEIKNREKTAKKIAEDVAKNQEIKTKLSAKIHQQSKSKSPLREKMASSHKVIPKLEKELEHKTKLEKSAAQTLQKASLKLQEIKRLQRKKSKRPVKKSKRPVKKSKRPVKRILTKSK